MHNPVVLIPPILVLIIAVVTHNVLRSLLVGIIAASFIAAKFNPIQTVIIAGKNLIEQSGLYNLITWHGNIDKIYIYGFLLLLGIIITLITYTGGTIAYSKKMSGKLRGKKEAESFSLLLSTFFFLDDYFNSLTTGSVVRPIFDHFKIARAKLAFLLDSMSSAICVLIPLTSWTAMIVAQLQESGVMEKATSETLYLGDPFLIYLQTIPYAFYPVAIVAATWFIVRRRISYGAMALHERIALETGNLFGGKEAPTQKIPEPEYGQGTVSDFLLPMGLLIGLIILGLLYTGNFTFFGGTNGLLDAIRSSESFPAFFFASLFSLALSSLYFLIRKKIKLNMLIKIYADGFNLMKNSLLLLLFAATLGTLLKDDLQTGQYLAHLLIGSVPNFLLPFIFFIASIIVTASTGSSWGTILVMLPIALPMIASAGGFTMINAQEAILLLPTIGAILSGSVAGAHLSPISDATVISSTAEEPYISIM